MKICFSKNEHYSEDTFNNVTKATAQGKKIKKEGEIIQIISLQFENKSTNKE